MVLVRAIVVAVSLLLMLAAAGCGEGSKQPDFGIPTRTPAPTGGPTAPENVSEEEFDAAAQVLVRLAEFIMSGGAQVPIDFSLLDTDPEGPPPAHADLQRYGTVVVDVTQQWAGDVDALCGSLQAQPLTAYCEYQQFDPGLYYLTFGAWSAPFPQQGSFCFFGDAVTLTGDFPVITGAFPGDPEDGAAFVVQFAQHPQLGTYAQFHAPGPEIASPVVTFELVEDDGRVARAILWQLGEDLRTGALHVIESGCYDLAQQDAPSALDTSDSQPLPTTEPITLTEIRR